jgi:hypothetical protein
MMQPFWFAGPTLVTIHARAYGHRTAVKCCFHRRSRELVATDAKKALHYLCVCVHIYREREGGAEFFECGSEPGGFIKADIFSFVLVSTTFPTQSPNYRDA